ncbi:MAG: hypothetical protein DI534_16180 [Leifsonia xyli]|uniref:Ribbon-helix-helix domain-containing protein n=1 Tax=Ancylobacter novellus TaxID=921 RepID=A0A2W5MAU7_ANCNO|nr:MAG: hypothetical protein DI565_05865 [Ancylobacter novellus]PZQ86819.1 MAG: hypothetical protein DI534_16180 [Leifsonia xyli]
MNEPSKPIELVTTTSGGQAQLVGVGPAEAEGIVVSGILAGEDGPTSREYNPDIVKRSVVVAGHKTSVSLEDAFWHALKDIARERGASLRGLVAEIDSNRRGGNLSSAVRLFVLDHYRRLARAPR